MNRSFKDFEHLIRLAALFAAALLVFVVARAELVPADFGKYGHYRPGAIADVAARPMTYAGRARCTECHEDEVNEAAPAKHKVISCETCHGALLSTRTIQLLRSPRPTASCCVCAVTRPIPANPRTSRRSWPRSTPTRTLA